MHLLPNNTKLLFSIFLIVVSLFLYGNTLFAGYAWDDRAAIIGNSDVSGNSSFTKILTNDFWGQDIKLSDSHKSYRPLTVLTFRLNFLLHGFNVYGYHAANILIYGLLCIVFYHFSATWLSSQGAYVAAMLFLLHPLHVEIVASLVGRADSLCALLYLLACYLYSKAVELQITSDWQRSSNTVSIPLQLRLQYYVAFLFAYILGTSACLAKEIGFTVFGALVALEFCAQMAAVQRETAQAKDKVSATMKLRSFYQFWRAILLRCVFQGGLLRMTLSTVSLLLVAYARLRINGEHRLYKWTVLENHISLLPSFQSRALSYAQTHAWMLIKLMYPRYLCFDYGLSCLPVIDQWTDWRNILPLLAYSAVAVAVLFAFYHRRPAAILALALVLLPLVPSLNILFPIGTLLAERLLLLPSAGVCLLAGEVLTVDLQPFWSWLIPTLYEFDCVCTWLAIQLVVAWKEVAAAVAALRDRMLELTKSIRSKGKENSVRKKPSGSGVSSDGRSRAGERDTNDPYRKVQKTSYEVVLWTCLLPILVMMGVRVVTRNRDWLDEYSLYKSALSVCPSSAKALSNYGMLLIGKGEYREAAEVLQKALELYPAQVSALVNLGIVQNRLDDFARGVANFDKAIIAGSPSAVLNAKAYGYRGLCLLSWWERGNHSDAAVRRQLLTEASASIDKALEIGWSPPLVLYAKASIASEMGDHELSATLLDVAWRRVQEFRAKDPSVPIQDTVEEWRILNQLGIALQEMGRMNEAEDVYRRGVSQFPDHYELLANFGSFLHAAQKFNEAKTILQRCLVFPAPAKSAAMNSLGLIARDRGDSAEARRWFEAALESLPPGHAFHTVIRNNLALAGTTRQ